MRCTNCGYENEFDAKFCNRCGTKLHNEEPLHRKRANFAIAYEKLQDAQDILKIQKPGLAVVSVRLSLESIIKTLCTECHIEMEDSAGKPYEMLSLIDRLQEILVIDANVASKLHEIRKIGNKGAHLGDTPPTQEEAEMAVEMLSFVLECIEDNYNPEACENQAKQHNKPMENPDYYSSKRKYFGMWSHCRTREDLYVIHEYCVLEKKALNGDVAAMLDIAIGFVSNKTYINKDGMVCMPKYRAKDGCEYFQEDAFDARYYYWILKAANKAIEYYNIGRDKEVPKRYIATTCLEGIKFSFHSLMGLEHYYVNGVSWNNGFLQKNHENQYKYVYDMYGSYVWDEIDYEKSISMGVMIYFMLFMFDYNPEHAMDMPIISSLHREKLYSQVRYLVTCLYYVCSKKFGYDNPLDLSESDYSMYFICKKNGLIALEELEQYAKTDGVNLTHYKLLVKALAVYEKNNKTYEKGIFGDVDRVLDKLTYKFLDKTDQIVEAVKSNSTLFKMLDFLKK